MNGLVDRLDSIDKRLLVSRDQDDGCTAPCFPRKATGGRAPSITIDWRHECAVLAADIHNAEEVALRVGEHHETRVV